MENLNNIINGHECVDLGLSVKWANCNLGANKPFEGGDFFSWGEITPKKPSRVALDYVYRNEIREISNNPRFDAATAFWGKEWRLPTCEEFSELEKKCKLYWVTYAGHLGFKVVGPNGNSIFLPAAGYWNGATSSLNYKDDYGNYWGTIAHKDCPTGICALEFDSGDFAWFGYHDACLFYNIRPVTK